MYRISLGNSLAKLCLLFAFVAARLSCLLLASETLLFMSVEIGLQPLIKTAHILTSC